jgi:crossover junction endodeoxyribonuclease RuvC
MSIRILGIDPGTRYVGYALLESDQYCKQLVISGTIAVAHISSYVKRLKMISEECRKIMKIYGPQQVAMESLFYHKNPGTLIKLAQARGVLMGIFLDYMTEDQLFEYSPNTVKSVTMGHGHSQKEWVQKNLQHWLKNKEDKAFSSFDESDALSIALCHDHFFWNPKIHHDKGQNRQKQIKKSKVKQTLASSLAHKW